jgi:TPR repeat protein
MKNVLVVIAGLMVSQLIALEINPSFEPSAVETYKLKAESGDAEAQYLYSYALDNGFGIKKNHVLAMQYAMKSADQGFGLAYRRVAMAFEGGHGVDKNVEKSQEWYKKFVEWAVNDNNLEHPAVKRGMGMNYLYGIGVKRNVEKGVKLLREAAESNDRAAQFLLAQFFRNEERNLVEAIKWYRKSAAQGNAYAQFSLGGMYEIGEGVATNYVEAANWYCKAAEQGMARAQRNLANCYKYGSGVENEDK